jgi:hypothetical protein
VALNPYCQPGIHVHAANRILHGVARWGFCGIGRCGVSRQHAEDSPKNPEDAEEGENAQYDQHWETYRAANFNGQIPVPKRKTSNVTEDSGFESS